MTIGYRPIAALAGAVLATGVSGCLPDWLQPDRPSARVEASGRPAVLPPLTESDRFWVRATLLEPPPPDAMEEESEMTAVEDALEEVLGAEPEEGSAESAEAQDVEAADAETSKDDMEGIAQTAPESSIPSAPTEETAGESEERIASWEIAPARHESLVAVLAEWAGNAGWKLDWRAPGVDFRPTADAAFAGSLEEAVEALLASPELGSRLRAELYPLNRWIVVREAGP